VPFIFFFPGRRDEKLPSPNYLYVEDKSILFKIKMKEYLKWKELPIKERVATATAVGLIFSGVLIAFISFFITYGIAHSVLMYIALAFIFGGGLLGFNLYLKSKWLEVDTRTKEEIQDAINKLTKRFEHETETEKIEDES